MIKTARFILGLVLLVILSQCHQHPHEAQPSIVGTQNPILGTYDLAGYDKSGALVFAGTIRLETIEQSHLKGQCAITKESGAPQNVFAGERACEAVLDGKAINLDLDPDIYDAGLLIDGELDNGTITGVWKLDSYGARTALGRIQAVRKRD